MQFWDSLLTACWTAAFALLVANESQAVVLQADFDHASLDLVSSSVVGTQVQLAGRDNHNPGNWKWLYFSALDVEEQSLVFQIDDNFETGGGNLVGHEMVYSYDQQTWQFFDQNVRNASNDTFTFWNDTPFSQATVYVAYGIPYPLSRVFTHTQQVSSSQWIVPTNSANSQLSVGLSPGGIDDLGRTIPQHDLFGYHITDPQGVAQKSKVVLAGGVHANETLGNFVLEGLVDFLISPDPQAALLRKYADFYVYPMINPDGRFAGYNRGTVESELLDPNRFWNPSDYGGLDELETLGPTMLTDTGGVDYLIDFHSTVVGKSGHFGFIFPSMQADPLWQAFVALEGEVQTRDAQLVDDTLAKFGRDHLNADFSITFETQFLADEGVDRFLDLGHSFGLAFAQSIAVFGDLDLDGELGFGDYQILTLYAESDFNGLSSIEAYLRGDLDGDGQNNIVDFGIFKDALEAQFGAGAFTRLFIKVPEPASWSLAFSAVSICLAMFYRIHS